MGGRGQIFNPAVGINENLLEKVEVEDLAESSTLLEKVEVEELKMSCGWGGQIFNFGAGVSGSVLQKVEVEELKMSCGGAAKSSTLLRE